MVATQQIIILGAPGAGKGTQSVYIARRLHVAHISTGNMLRSAVAAETKIGKSAKKIMDTGHLISDEIILDLIQERITAADCANGFLFDGFPRTVGQAEAIERHNISISHVIEIDVDDSEIIRRLSGRRVHLSSGRSYHVLFNPPKQIGIDDETGEPLVHRPDDHETTIKDRLSVYHQQTKPLISFYKQRQQQEKINFHRVDGGAPINAVTKAIDAIFI